MEGKKPKVLLVEDDRVFADILKKRFALRNVVIVHSGTGKSALEELEKDADFDLILLDISLPDMDGFEILEHISRVKELAAIPVVIVSNFTVEKDNDWAGKKGVRRVVKKISVMPEEIVDIALSECKT